MTVEQRRLNSRIAHRVNARLATDAERRIDLTGADSGPDREDLQICQFSRSLDSATSPILIS